MEETNTNKKRILYFIPTFPVLTETFIAREITKLIEIDEVDIRILALCKGSGSIQNFVLNKTTFRRLNLLDCVYAVLYFVRNSKGVLDIYKEIFTSSGLWKLSNLYLFFKSLVYSHLIKLFKPYHVHCHFLSDPSTIILIASRILNVPFSVSGHAKDVFLTGTLIKEKAKYSKFIAICNSYALKKASEQVDPADKDKIKLLFHGIDINIFSDPPKMQKPNKPVIFLGGTRLVEKKGIKYLIEASALLKSRGVKHQIDLVGLGPQYDELKNLVKEKGLENYVFIHGEGKGTPFDEVKEYYKIADIFVLPSIETGEGDADGVPTVIIEAAIAKLPIISTNAGGISDLISEKTGLIVPQRDEHSLATAIEKLIFNPELRKELGNAAYEQASKMFDINVNVRKLQEGFLS